MAQQLNRKRILITREKEQAKSLQDKIKEQGGIPVITPLLKIISYADARRDMIFNSIEQFDWIFFTSVNGVHHFFKQLQNQNQMKQCKIAVVGHKTEEAIKMYGLSAHFIPSTYNAETMAQEFLELYPDVEQVLFIRGNLSRQTLLEAFANANISYEKLVVYETIINKEEKRHLNDVVKKGIDYLTFTSPSTVEAFVQLVDLQLLSQIKTKPCFCIGTTTEKSAQNNHFKQTYIPRIFTVDHMVQKMIEVANKETC